ncbi:MULTISPECIES: IS3 family transposase [Actinomycetes]|uniref:IS3 family transposase n=1 Tax=Actinomycetes TaxID=1760 RepID=UPI003D158004
MLLSCADRSRRPAPSSTPGSPRPRPARTARRADEALAHELTFIHVASRHAYVVPRVHAERRRPGRRVNRKRVARLMGEHGIQGAHHRRRRLLTRPGKRAKPAHDLIGRGLHAGTPGTQKGWSAISPRCPPARARSTSPVGRTWPPVRPSATQ